MGKIKKPLLYSIIGLAVCTATISVSTYAWFTVATRTGNVLESAGDLSFNNAVLTYYRWEFPFDENGNLIISPSSFEGGNAVSGIVTYTPNQATVISDPDDARTMNMFDPYLTKLYPTIDMKSRLYIRFDSSIATACDFDIAVFCSRIANYVFVDTSPYHDLLSKYVKFTALPLSQVTIPTGATLNETYDAIDDSFATASPAPIVYQFGEDNAIELASITKFLNREVTGSENITASYYICIDYDAAALSAAYSDTDLFNKYVLEQDFDFVIKATQNGI